MFLAQEKKLMLQMLNHEREPNLGFQNNMAEAGIYHTVLSANQLHVWENGSYAFVRPKNIKQKKY